MIHKDSEYLNFLCGMIRVDGDSPESPSYRRLADVLHRLEFYSILGNDEDRGNDGVDLRDLYESETGVYPDVDGPSTMLEMLIALAKRMAWVLVEGDDKGFTDAWCFWQIIRNLGLDRYSDSVWYDLNGEMKVRRAISKVLGREYNRDGSGGLFPLRTPHEDQRGVEIWGQMMAYLLENFWP